MARSKSTGETDSILPQQMALRCRKQQPDAKVNRPQALRADGTYDKDLRKVVC